MRGRTRKIHAVYVAITLGLTLILSGSANAENTGCTTAVGENFTSAAPSSEGASAQRLVSLLRQLDDARFDIRALLVMRNCHVILERYGSGLGRNHNHAMYSVTKSISSTLVGALLYQGKIGDIDSAITTLIQRPSGVGEDEWKNLDHVSLKNVMQMASGFDYHHNPVSNPIYDTKQDRVRTVINQKFIAPPGTRFNYSDADVTLTGTVIAGASGSSLLDFAEKTLFEPLHMRNYAWWFPDQGGRYPGGWGLRLRPMDMLKIGQLYLQNGEWNGNRIFAPGYRGMAWASGVNERYGLHWWRGRVNGIQIFFANGFKGQRIYVIPALNAVIALASSLPGPEELSVTGEVTKAVIEAFNEDQNVIADDATAQLIKSQETGFNGETRVRQELQDSPRRF